MRKTAIIAVLSMLMLALTAAVALGATSRGTNARDALYGSSYADTIYGYAGDDSLFGRPGNDQIYGGSGNDKLYGGRGTDRIYGGYGNDFVNSVGDDSNADYVDCGPGYDTANRTAGPGAGDRFVNCEKFAY